jgi:hypothetical protein
MSQPRTNRPGPAPQSAGDDEALLRALRNGDEGVFSELVDRWSGMMLRLALTHIKSQPIAEEIVQEAGSIRTPVLSSDLGAGHRRESGAITSPG